MALFGGKDKKKQKKTSLVERMGVQVERVPTQEEQIEKSLHDNILLAYNYLRERIDRGCNEYYRTGNFAKLEEFVARPALDSMIDRLQALRNANIYWQQPNRQQTQADLRVIPAGLKLDPDGRPLEFIVEERFLDFSVHKKLTDGGEFIIDAEIAGVPRAIQSKILVRNGNDFKLVEVIEVKDATI